MSQTTFIDKLLHRNNSSVQRFPDTELATDFVNGLFRFLFTPFKGHTQTAENLETELNSIQNTFSSLLFDLLHDEEKVEEHAKNFFDALPAIYDTLLEDANAVVQFDPAAESVEEVLVAYPGFYATAIYRFANRLFLQEIATLPRLLSEYAHSKTGIDIHPGAQIGKSFFIDHGTGIVIGESVIIGDNVKIYQGVTLGALNVAKEFAKKKRHPTIENNVIIYSGATILGGETKVGHDSIIGGNVWLTHSVEPFSGVYQKSEVVVRDQFPHAEPVNFII